MRALSLLYEVEAAAMIQAVIRGKQARKRSIVPEHLRLASVSKEPEPEPIVIRPPTPPKAPYMPRGLDISTAPVVIQAAWRGYLGRRRAIRFRKRLAQVSSHSQSFSATVSECLLSRSEIHENLGDIQQRTYTTPDQRPPRIGKQAGPRR